MIIESLIGVLTGGLGSWISRGLGIWEKKQDYAHELKLQEMQMKARREETENELAIVQEQTFSDMREASYAHDTGGGQASQWVINTLRMVRPALTLLLILLVWTIWLTVGQEDATTKLQIIDGVLYMAGAALGWWFGARDHEKSKRLPWQ